MGVELNTVDKRICRSAGGGNPELPLLSVALAGSEAWGAKTRGVHPKLSLSLYHSDLVEFRSFGRCQKSMRWTAAIFSTFFLWEIRCLPAWNDFYCNDKRD